MLENLNYVAFILILCRWESCYRMNMTCLSSCMSSIFYINIVYINADQLNSLVAVYYLSVNIMLIMIGYYDNFNLILDIVIEMNMNGLWNIMSLQQVELFCFCNEKYNWSNGIFENDFKYCYLYVNFICITEYCNILCKILVSLSIKNSLKLE